MEISTISVDLLTENYANEIFELTKLIMNEEQLQPTIYSSEGYLNYLYEQFRLPIDLRETIFLGIVEDGQLLGFSELRKQVDGLYGINACVKPECRIKGIGTILFEKSIDYAIRSGVKFIDLDVYEKNKIAYPMYLKLGFIKQAEHVRYIGEMCPPEYEQDFNINKCFIKQYAQAQITHQTFGFSSLQIQTSTGEYSIGRIRDEFYRITSLKALLDSELMQILYQIDPKRKLFILIPNDQHTILDHYKKLDVSIHMRLEFPHEIK